MSQVMDIRFVDILLERRLQNDDSFFLSRLYNPTIAYKKSTYLNPEDLKRIVLHSSEVNQVIEQINEECEIPKDKLYLEALTILEEMALDRRLVVIRVLGVAISKLLKQCCSGLLIDRKSIQKIKSKMGNCPVLLLPSHRSYADFVLMAFVTFCEDLQVPAVAAGMDFHGMRGMGSVLRQTGAFFMRRSLSGADPLYKTVFRRYVHALVQEHHTPLEFFIEGTRSRTAKALYPKTGLLGMALEPFFFGRVPDVTIVPVSISYDRVLEEDLFAYELLGVPKPRETTSGLFQSLQKLNERYGTMRIRCAEPISVKDFLGDQLNRSEHSIMPAYMQTLTAEEAVLVHNLAHEVLYRQQQGMIIGMINIIALILSWNESQRQTHLTMKELEHMVHVWTSILELMGSSLIKQSLPETLNIHKNMIRLDKNGIVQLATADFIMASNPEHNLKGHNLASSTMTVAVPFIKLQIYINPLLFYLSGPALVMTILKWKGSINKEHLLNDASKLLDLFRFEFIFPKSRMSENFHKWLVDLSILKVLFMDDNCVSMVENDTNEILISLISPFLYSYLSVFQILSKMCTEITEKQIFIETQKQIEVDLFKDKKNNITELCYSLNLDTISNAINSLTNLGCLQKSRRNSIFYYRKVDHEFNKWQFFLSDFSTMYMTQINKCSKL